MADHGNLLEHVGPAPDEGRPFDRLRHVAILDQIGFTRRKYELAVRDIHLPAAERHGIQPFLDGAQNILGFGRAGQHEGIGHPGQHDAAEILAPAVAGKRNAHEPGVQTVRDVPAQDSVFDQDGPGRGRAFIVDVERSPPGGQRAVIHDRAYVGRDALTDQITERRRLLAIEIRLQTVPNGLVQQNPGPAAPQDHGQNARGRVHGIEIQDRLPGGFSRIRPRPIFFMVKGKRHATAAAEGAHLSIVPFFGNTRHLKPG